MASRDWRPKTPAPAPKVSNLAARDSEIITLTQQPPQPTSAPPADAILSPGGLERANGGTSGPASPGDLPPGLEGVLSPACFDYLQKHVLGTCPEFRDVLDGNAVYETFRPAIVEQLGLVKA